MDSLADPSGLRRWAEQQRRQRELLEDPFCIRKQREMFERLYRPPVLQQLARQQGQLDEFFRGPAILRTLPRFSGTASEGLISRAADYRADAATEAEAEELDKGADPLDRLSAEREAILTCLARVRESAIVAGLLEVPVPNVVLALIVAFVVLGEVADEILRERERADKKVA